MKAAALAVAFCVAAASARAQTPLAGIAFLVGRWEGGRGSVAQTGGSSRGSSTITEEAGGKALLRRDHTDLFDRTGAPIGGFEQIMLIYPEAGTLHGEYTDGQHVIHYTQAAIVPGRSVTFTSTGSAAAPVFRLTYNLLSPDTLGVAFALQPQGAADFRPIASGTLRRTR